MAIDDHAMLEPGDEAPRTPALPAPPAEAAKDTSPAAAAAAAAAAEEDSSSTSTVRSAGDDDDDDGDDGGGGGGGETAKAGAGEAASSTAADAATDAKTDRAPDPDEPPPAKRRSLCDICHGAPAKYKCPRCPQAYCSVVCARTHRDNHPPEPAPDPTATAPDHVPPPPSSSSAGGPPTAAAAAAGRHPFGVLDDAPELQRLFAQYPGLPARLRAIYEATQPPPAVTSSAPPSAADGGSGGWRGRGGRGRGRGAGGRGGPHGDASSSFAAPYKPSQPWTKEQGLRQGQRALRQARVDPGDDGDGVRAYCELVLHLLGRAPAAAAAAAAAAETHGGDGSADATALVRQEVARADAELVEQLLQADTAAGGLR